MADGGEGRGQGTGDRSQTSEVRGRRAERGLLDQERGRIVYHGTEHATYLMVDCNEFDMLFFRNVSAIEGKVERGFRLAILAIAVSEFAHEVCFIRTPQPLPTVQFEPPGNIGRLIESLASTPTLAV